ncbi:hypothetical protein [Melittangium boletus]|uniref:Uncharacterized protein n=1 Tax=Melittangium boletus DSM 14713 TaxID=1294270 RepID=A0A250I824_9BACT|nr:hypothetical protein [Melittangium boletus]ATB27312.1 hypothetical protein MEBOL_000750 [Melittangium boletus DSM 14713]
MASPSPSVLSLSALSLVLASGCTRAYLQNEGRYEFSAVDVLRDDCGLISTPDSLWDGTLSISGDVVRLDSDWRHLRLIGAFLQQGGPDDSVTFSLDGTESNAAITLGTDECIADQIAVHLEGTTQRATEFKGVMSVRVLPRVEQPSCACQLWVTYRAVQNAAPSASFP